MPIFHHLAVVDTEDGPMPMYIAYPEGPGPFPAVAVISGQPGPSSLVLSSSGGERLRSMGRWERCLT
jgi:dienelactone hydrolase